VGLEGRETTWKYASLNVRLHIRWPNWSNLIGSPATVRWTYGTSWNVAQPYGEAFWLSLL